MDSAATTRSGRHEKGNLCKDRCRGITPNVSLTRRAGPRGAGPVIKRGHQGKPGRSRGGHCAPLSTLCPAPRFPRSLWRPRPSPSRARALTPGGRAAAPRFLLGRKKESAFAHWSPPTTDSSPESPP